MARRARRATTAQRAIRASTARTARTASTPRPRRVRRRRPCSSRAAAATPAPGRPTRCPRLARRRHDRRHVPLHVLDRHRALHGDRAGPARLSSATGNVNVYPRADRRQDDDKRPAQRAAEYADGSTDADGGPPTPHRDPIYAAMHASSIGGSADCGGRPTRPPATSLRSRCRRATTTCRARSCSCRNPAGWTHGARPATAGLAAFRERPLTESECRISQSVGDNA